LLEHIEIWFNNISVIQKNRKQKMFKKLVSNLPYNPSLITQVGFYADRLRQEKSIRRLSFVFIALAMAVQSLAVISPPERSLAASNNHIQNGVRTKQDILNGYDFVFSDLKDIYTKFNISREDLAALPNTPNVTIRSNDGNDWWTTGRTSLWNYSKVNNIYKANEVSVQYRGQDTPSKSDDASIYARQLRAWDIVNPYNTYRAFQGRSSATGQEFWILIDCGNITWKGNWKDPVPPPSPTPTPTPPPTIPEPPKPELEIKKSITNNLDTVKPGDTFTYRIEYRNKIIGSVAKDVVIQDSLDIKNFNVVSPKNLNISGSGVLRHSVGEDLRGSSTYSKLDIQVRLKDPLPSGERVCNGARIEASNASAVSTKQDVCIDVITPCPFDPNIPNVNNPNCVEPVVTCRLVDSQIDLALRKVTFKTVVTSSNPVNTQIKSYNYEFGDGKQQSFNVSELTHTTEHTYGPGEFEANTTITYRTTGQEQTTDKTKDCIGTIVDFEEDRDFVLSKNVKNLTQDLSDANNTTVRAGDVVEYTLITANTNNFPRTVELISDDIGDILDYASLDLVALEESGGKFDSELNRVYWENITIPANSEVKNVFKVQLLDPIPATNRPSTTSGDYDCQIDNTYGNIVNMSVQCPVVKGIETLPNTGPGTSLIAGTSVAAVVGYFFARSRLLAKEINIIRTDYAMSGGA
jgi:uncharacterized repeat protein (TIGR01451 family)